MWTIRKLERAADAYRGPSTPEGIAEAGLLLEVVVFDGDRQVVRHDAPLVGFAFAGRPTATSIEGEMVLLGRPRANYRLPETRYPATAEWDTDHWIAWADDLVWAVDARPLMAR